MREYQFTSKKSRGFFHKDYENNNCIIVVHKIKNRQRREITKNMKFLGNIFLILFCGLAQAALPIYPITDVGDIALSTNVSQNGAFEATVPILLPPALNKLEPNLTLSYNSQVGNGLLGVGWRLGGLSSIERCVARSSMGPTQYPITYNDHDNFCLDGKLLIPVEVVGDNDASCSPYGGFQVKAYKTEIDEFSRIIACSSATVKFKYFLVWHSDGSLYQYGVTGDSRIHVPNVYNKDPATMPEPDPPYGYLLSKVTDINGNSLSVKYFMQTLFDSSGNASSFEFFPKYITYGANENTNFTYNRIVVFGYEERQDTNSRYIGSIKFVTNKIISSIDTYINGTVQEEVNSPATTVNNGEHISHYKLHYNYTNTSGAELSLLSQIYQCGSDPQTLVMSCKVPLSVSWAETPPEPYPGPEFSVQTMQTTNLCTYPCNRETNYHADFDGDGYKDRIIFYTHSINGPSADGPDVLRAILGQDSRTEVFDTNQQTAQTQFDSYYVYPQWKKIFDVDNDGREEFVYWSPDTARLMSLELNADNVTWNSKTLGHQMPASEAFVADANGDGRLDILWRMPNSDGAYELVTALNNGSGFDNYANIKYLIDSGVPTVPGTRNLQSVHNHRPIQYFDVNNDGRIDFLINTIGDVNVCRLYVSTVPPDGLNESEANISILYREQDLVIGDCYVPPSDPTPELRGHLRYFPLDFNGDGSIDLISIREGQGFVRLGNGASFINEEILIEGVPFNSSTGAGRGYYLDYARVFDFNADGKSDLVYGYGRVIYVRLSTGSGLSDPIYLSENPFGTVYLAPREITDLNGDLIPELIIVGALDSYDYYILPSGYPSDSGFYYKNVVSGFSGATHINNWSVTYAKASEKVGIEESDSTSVNPVEVSATLLVDTVTTPLNENLRYSFSNPRKDKQRNQFLGYEYVNTENRISGEYTEKRFHQDFPLSGKLKYIKQCNGQSRPRCENNGETINNSQLTHDYFDYVYYENAYPINPGDLSVKHSLKYYSVFPLQHQKTTFDNYGRELTILTNRYEGYDASDPYVIDPRYGQVKKHITSTKLGQHPDLYTSVVTNNFKQIVNPQTWILDRNSRTEKYNHGPNERGVANTSDVNVITKTYYDNGLIDCVVREPDERQLRVQTCFTYDEYGIVTAEVKTAFDGRFDSVGNPQTFTPSIRSQQYLWDYSTWRTGQPQRSIYNNQFGLESTFTFNARDGSISSIADPNGLTITNEYDNYGRIKRIQYPDGKFSTTEYVSGCSTYSCENSSSISITVTTKYYDSLGQEVVPESVAHYDQLLRKSVSHTKGFDGQTDICVSQQYYSIGISAGMLETSTLPYDCSVGSVNAPHLSHYYYDNKKRINKYFGPGKISGDRQNGVVETIYDGNIPNQGVKVRSLVEILNYDSQTQNQTRLSTSWQDARGLTVKTQDPNLVTNNYYYDVSGNLRQVVVAQDETRKQQYWYDKINRLIAQNDPNNGGDASTGNSSDNRNWQFRYNGFGDLVWRKDPKGNIIEYNFDNLGRIIRNYSPTDQTEINYLYDQGANAIGAITNITNSNGYTENYKYNQIGQLYEKTALVGGVSYRTNLAYDKYGRISRVDYPETFENQQRLSIWQEYRNDILYKICKGSVTACEIMLWEATDANILNQITRARLGDAITQNRDYYVGLGGTVKNIYSSRLNETTTNSLQALNYDEINNVGQVLLKQDFNRGRCQDRIGTCNSNLTGYYERYSYDTMGRLDRTSSNSFENIDRDFGYTPTGNIDVALDVNYNGGSPLSNFYQYNPLGGGPDALAAFRFIAPSSPNQPVPGDANNDGIINSADIEAISQSIMGATISLTGNGDINNDGTVDLRDAVEVMNSSAFSQLPQNSLVYDKNGNVIRDGQREYNYDSRNQTTSITSSSAHADFRYHPMGGLLSKQLIQNGETTVTHYVNELFNVIQKNNDISYKHYVNSPFGVLAVVTTTPQAETLNYLYSDRQGSITAISDINGDILERFNYSPYGQRLSGHWRDGKFSTTESNVTNISYTGHEYLPEFGLIHMQGRVYNPETRLFLSPDPVTAAPASASGYSRYVYASNDPVNRTDPFGYQDIYTSGGTTIYGSDDSGTGYVSEPWLQEQSHEDFINELAGRDAFNERNDQIRNSISSSPGNSPRNPSELRQFINQNSGFLIYGSAFEVINSYRAPLCQPECIRRIGAWEAIGSDIKGWWDGLSRVDIYSNVVGSLVGGTQTKGILFGLKALLLNLKSGFKTSVANRGLSKHGGVLSSTTNSSGGEVVTAVGKINQNDIAPYVNNGLYKGEVNIISGAHGSPNQMIPDVNMFKQDVARFGNIPGVNVHDITKMKSSEITEILNNPGTTIGGFCDSAACLKPFQ